MKAWYNSKTLWISFVVFVVGLLRGFGVEIPIIEDGSASMEMVVGVIFFILRLITKEEVSATK